MLKKALQDNFIKNNIILFIGSMVIAILNYAFHPIMSRMMNIKDFGEVQALISLTYLTGILLIILGTIVTNIISNHNTSSNDHIKILSQLYKLSLYIIGSFAIGIILLSPYLMHILKFDSALSFLPLSILLLVSIPFTFYNFYLRGKQKFKAVSIAGIIISATKILFAIILVSLGLRVFGAISAIALATFIALLYVLYKTRHKFRLSLKEKISFTPALKKELSYGILIFFSLGYVTFLYTSDVLFVKYFFPPETAGLYSGIATIARIIFFATASVAGVLLPTIKIKNLPSKNIATLQKAIIIIVIMGIISLSIFFFFPATIISLLIGENYATLAPLLPLAGIYILLVSIVNVFYSYFLALRNRQLIIISSLGFIITILLLFLNHATLQAIVINYIIGTIATIVLIGISFFRNFNKTH